MLDCSLTRFFWHAPFFELVSTTFPLDDSMIPKPIHQWTCAQSGQTGQRGPGKKMHGFLKNDELSRHNHQQFSQIIGNYEQILNS
jgi:hypothetical protein